MTSRVPASRATSSGSQITHGTELEVEIGDVRHRDTVRRAVRGVQSVYHFAAQVAVTTSLEAPLDDAARQPPGNAEPPRGGSVPPRPPAIVFTSTNKVYGSLPDVELVENERRYEPRDRGLRATGVGEERPLYFCTPYGCSKGAADQYVLDWSASFAVPTVVFRMSCIYGPHQCGTEDQGWVAHFLHQPLDDRPITIYGTGKQVRDILFVDDLVDALMLAGGRRRRTGRTRLQHRGRPGQRGQPPRGARDHRRAVRRAPDVRSCDWRRATSGTTSPTPQPSRAPPAGRPRWTRPRASARCTPG